MSVLARVRGRSSPTPSMAAGVAVRMLPMIAAVGLIATAVAVATAKWWAILVLAPTVFVGVVADRGGRG